MPGKHINFIIPVWGSDYVKTFINYCLPSLSSKNNFQKLKFSDGHRLFICTDTDGEAAVSSCALLSSIRSHIDVTFINIDKVLKEITKSGETHREECNYQRMTAAHNLAIEQTDRRSACSFLMPDNIVYDGFVTGLLGYLDRGLSVLMYSIAVDRDRAAKELEEYRLDDQILDIANEDICRLAMRHLHHSTACSFIDSENFLPNGNIHMRLREDSALLRLSYLHPILVIPKGVMPLIPEGTTFDDGGFFEAAADKDAVAYPRDSGELVMFALDKSTQKSYLERVRTNHINLLEMAVRISNIDPVYLNNLKRVFIYNHSGPVDGQIRKFDDIILVLFKFIELKKHYEQYIDFYKVKMTVLYSGSSEDFLLEFNRKTDEFINEFKKTVLAKLNREFAGHYEKIFSMRTLLAKEMGNKSGKLDILEYIRSVFCLIGGMPGAEPDLNAIPHLDTLIIRNRLSRLRSILNTDAESYFYGGGDESKIYLSMLYGDTEKVKGIIEDNPAKAGTFYKGVRHISLEELDFSGESEINIIIMSPNYDGVIYEKLKAADLPDIVSVYRWGGKDTWERA